MSAHANPRVAVKRPGSQRQLVCRRSVAAYREASEFDSGVGRVRLADLRCRPGAWIKDDIIKALPDRMESFDREAIARNQSFLIDKRF